MEDLASTQHHIDHYRQLLAVEFDLDRHEIVARRLKEAQAELQQSRDAEMSRRSSVSPIEKSRGEEA